MSYYVVATVPHSVRFNPGSCLFSCDFDRSICRAATVDIRTASVLDEEEPRRREWRRFEFQIPENYDPEGKRFTAYEMGKFKTFGEARLFLRLNFCREGWIPTLDDDQDWIRLDVRSMDKLSKGESQILASYRVWEDGMDTATLLALKSFTQAEGLLDDGSSLAKIEMSAQRYSRDYFNSGIWLKPEVVKELILGWREELSRETSYGRFFGWGFPDDFLGNDVSTRTDNFNYSPLLNTRFEPWQKNNGEQITLSVLPI